MSKLEFYENLKPGTRLQSITIREGFQDGWNGHSLGGRKEQAKSIVITHESGQMANVAWARVETNEGVIHMVNLALVESVTFVDTEQEQPK